MTKIVLEEVEVTYPVYGAHYNSLRRALVNFTTSSRFFNDKNQVTLVKGLNNISFTLNKGDRLGLIGTNGAGKSTLLKTMAQLYLPSKGKILIEGKVSTLFDVTLGIDTERTGYHNIYYMGRLLGLTKKEIDKIIPDVIDFSELKEFIYMPVKTYSAGMRMRLGFAICTSINPSILLLDEAIGAGDKNFVHKAAKRAKELYDRAEIMVIASHSDKVIKEFCNKALWLHEGNIKMFGKVDEVLKAYNQI
jgi:ABC-type polysaccharide/polyol phosphate transport system ATPase subunit